MSVRLSVTFVDYVKTTTKDSFEVFSRLGSHTILVFFHTKGDSDIPTATPLTRASNLGGVGRNRDSKPVPVDAATGEVLSTWSPVDQGHRLASCDTYIVGRILPRAIRSPSPWFYSARATKRALAVALYTITIDRVYDSKA